MPHDGQFRVAYLDKNQVVRPVADTLSGPGLLRLMFWLRSFLRAFRRVCVGLQLAVMASDSVGLQMKTPLRERGTMVRVRTPIPTPASAMSRKHGALQLALVKRQETPNVKPWLSRTASSSALKKSASPAPAPASRSKRTDSLAPPRRVTGKSPPLATSRQASSPSTISLLECGTCKELVAKEDIIFQGSKGKVKKCKECHNSERALRADFSKRHQKHVWQRMSPTTRRKMIVDNKKLGEGHGKKRTVEVTRTASIQDTLKQSREKQFMNLREFSKKCREKWGMSYQQSKDLFQKKLKDPTVPQGKDEMGWVTISWLAARLV